MLLFSTLLIIIWLIRGTFLASGFLVCPNDILVTPPGREIRASVDWVIPSPPSNEYRLTFQSHTPGFFPVGISVVTYIFTSTVSNNVSECNFTVTVEKRDWMQPQIISCPGEVVVGAQPGVQSAYVHWEEPVVVDDSGTVSLLGQTHYPGSWSVGTDETVNYNFADPYGNNIHCNFNVRVITDNNPPTVFGCPSEDQTFVMYGSEIANISWGEPFAIDESTEVSVHQTHRPGDTFPIGVTTVEYVFEDSAGNVASCRFNIRVSLLNDPSTALEGNQNSNTAVIIILVVAMFLLMAPTLFLSVGILLSVKRSAKMLSSTANRSYRTDCYYTRSSPQELQGVPTDTMSTTSGGYETPIDGPRRVDQATAYY